MLVTLLGGRSLLLSQLKCLNFKMLRLLFSFCVECLACEVKGEEKFGIGVNLLFGFCSGFRQNGPCCKCLESWIGVIPQFIIEREFFQYKELSLFLYGFLDQEVFIIQTKILCLSLIPF